MTAPAPTVERPSIAWGVVGAIALAKVTFQLATATRSGLHRDEFYYLAGGHHLAWGYVDHPPLVPALYRLGEALFGHTQLALHVLPALVGGAYVVVGALLAREFGGRQFAQAAITGHYVQRSMAGGVALSEAFDG